MIRETLWTYKWVNPLIGLRGLRGITSKNRVPSILSVIFYYGIIIWMIRETHWIYKWVNPFNVGMITVCYSIFLCLKARPSPLCACFIYVKLHFFVIFLVHFRKVALWPIKMDRKNFFSITPFFRVPHLAWSWRDEGPKSRFTPGNAIFTIFQT